MNNIKSKNNEKQQIEDLVISKSIVVKWKIVNFFKNIVCAITLLLIIYSIFIEPDSTGIKYELIDKTTIENVKILDKIKTQNNEIKYRVQIGKRKEIVTESVYKKYIADINALEVPQTSLLIYNPEDDLDGFSNAKQFTLINYPWNKKRLFDEANTKECVKIIKKNNDLSVESIAKQLPVVIDSATNVFVQPGSELKEYKINNKFPKIPSGVIPIMIWVFWLLGIDRKSTRLNSSHP